jgi:hypothetical protein
MSHPRQEDDRRLGDNDEAEQGQIPNAKPNSPVTKAKVSPLQAQNNEGSDDTTLEN